jgi:hypothetical protein
MQRRHSDRTYLSTGSSCKQITEISYIRPNLHVKRSQLHMKRSHLHIKDRKLLMKSSHLLMNRLKLYSKLHALPTQRPNLHINWFSLEANDESVLYSTEVTNEAMTVANEVMTVTYKNTGSYLRRPKLHITCHYLKRHVYA